MDTEKRKAPVRGCRRVQRGTAGTQPPARHTQRGGKLTAQDHCNTNKKESQEGTHNEHNRRFTYMDGRGLDEPSHRSAKGGRAVSRSRGARSVEQRKGMKMERVIDYVGRFVVVIALVALLGAVSGFDRGLMSFNELLGFIGASAAAMGFGAMMMKRGGKNDE